MDDTVEISRDRLQNLENQLEIFQAIMGNTSEFTLCGECQGKAEEFCFQKLKELEAEQS